MADHGRSSQSSTSQPLSSVSQMPAESAGCPDAIERVLCLGAAVEELTAGARVDRARLAVVDPEPVRGDVGVAADDDDRARAHVLLLADDLRDALGSVLGECILWMLERVESL